MLTLHFLFPHELLPALDLLDRKLITCLLLSNPSNLNTDAAALTTNPSLETFYIQSASAVTQNSSKPSKFRRAFSRSEVFYEARLDSWNCTCPAFAYSAFGNLAFSGTAADDLSTQVLGEGEEESSRPIMQRGGDFGGSLTLCVNGVPICKHILAAVIGKAAPEIFPGVRTMHASADAMAGWAGGWGE